MRMFQIIVSVMIPLLLIFYAPVLSIAGDISYVYDDLGRIKSVLMAEDISTAEQGSVGGLDNTQDFNGDPKADILFRHSSTGEVWLYEMDGYNIVAGGSNSVITVDPVWIIAGLTDFNGDGKTDILLRHSGTGQVWLYEMDGHNIIAGGSNSVITVDPVWTMVGLKDFNGDSKADILFRHSGTGQVWLYEMDGHNIIAGGSNPVITVNPVWTIVGLEDFNGDGKADILLRHSGTGVIYLYEMNGHVISSSNSVAGLILDWVIAGLKDFNGDGKADILLRHSATGQIWLYQMDGSSVVSSNSVAAPVLDLAIAGLEDFSGDGKADILLRNTLDGFIWLYEMNGHVITSSYGVGGPVLDWAIAGLKDFNGDRKTDILLRHSNTGAIWMFLMYGQNIDSHSVGQRALDWKIVSD